MSKMRYRISVFSLALSIISFAEAADTHHRFHSENVLGTSMEIEVYGASREQAETALIDIENQIQGFELALSTWQEDSAINSLNNNQSLSSAPAPLIEVLEHCKAWFKRSLKHFSCRLGEFKQRWREAEIAQSTPDRVAFRKRARAIARMEAPVQFSGQQISLTDDIILDVDGLAKGWIIDELMTSLVSQLPNATGLKIDIGGDSKFWGQPQKQKLWHVGLSSAEYNSDSEPHNGVLAIPAMAIASSGHNQRFYEIERRRFSHLLSAKEGWPLDMAPAAVVIAPDAVTADAVATALSAQSPTSGIDWVNQLDQVEAMVQLDNIVVTSDGWYQYLDTSESASIAPQLLMDYQIPRINAAKYHKPYLAVWITDLKNTPIRHLLLLGESTRWVKENKRWWRRAGRKTPGILDTMARPTRKPGHYQLTWNGLDDWGKPVNDDHILLHIEASREAGGHNYKKIDIKLSSFNKPIHLPADGELGRISIAKAPSGVSITSENDAVLTRTTSTE